MLKLIPDRIEIRSGKQFIVLLNQKTAHILDLHIGDRVKVKNGKKELTAILQISEEGVLDNHIGLYMEAWKELKARRGQRIRISLAEKPLSVKYIKEKLQGKRLTPEEINEIVKDITEDDLSDIELTYFVSGCYVHGLNNPETAALTKSIVKHGSRINFGKRKVVDKHCIGGVPGNRTTMLIIPIVTATGLLMPKTSSRAITSPSGTGDTMEVIANIKNDAKKLKKIAEKVGGFITWGGGVDLAAADDHMIRVRHPLSLDPEGMLLASIMAKKHSVGAKRVLIDIPVGPQVKVKDLRRAKHLKNRFMQIGKMLGMKVKVIFTDGSQPIGDGIGPLLEVQDVMKVLNNDPTAPADLREKAIYMAGLLLEMGGKAISGTGKMKARKILKKGLALEQMNKIIDAQGRKRIPKNAKLIHEIKSEKDGKVVHIDNKIIARLARVAGAPLDAPAGIYLKKKLGEKVKKGEALYEIHSDNEDRMGFAKDMAKQDSGYVVH
ncbi:MAG: AMP phosphorylase [Patescibacteria group bacterium]|nr:AMP phosphorylase [Patescibacteria group bacterium]